MKQIISFRVVCDDTQSPLDEWKAQIQREMLISTDIVYFSPLLEHSSENLI